MENLMPRFYFNLVSKHAHIPDESGKELYTLNDACVYARKLIDKILFRVGHAGAVDGCHLERPRRCSDDYPILCLTCV